MTDHSATFIVNVYCNIPEVSTYCKPGILKLNSVSDNYVIYYISKNSLVGIIILLSQGEFFVIKMYIISIVI